LNPVGFTLSTCSTLSTLVSPLIELSSKHQNSQESFQPFARSLRQSRYINPSLEAFASLAASTEAKRLLAPTIR
jgi:hypothetical protein